MTRTKSPDKNRRHWLLVEGEGVVIEHGPSGEFAVGVWVMPNNGGTGTLEDFLVDLIPEQDLHWSHARRAVADATNRGAIFKPQYRSKAELHTWLAWQKEPGAPLGRAVESAYFVHDRPPALAFVAWFRRMFPADHGDRRESNRNDG